MFCDHPLIAPGKSIEATVTFQGGRPARQIGNLNRGADGTSDPSTFCRQIFSRGRRRRSRRGGLLPVRLPIPWNRERM
jgi:hypothetical protein